MKHPFRFTDAYIADLEQILNAKLIRDKRTIVVSYINGDSEIINFNYNVQCIEVFERFCEACMACGGQQRAEGE